MNDNLKTWPEHIRLTPRTDGEVGWTISTEFFPTYQEHDGRAYWHDSQAEIPEGTAVIKYIREDIAKERENKLIKEALTYGYSMSGYPVRPKDKDISFVFLHAGLEELK